MAAAFGNLCDGKQQLPSAAILAVASAAAGSCLEDSAMSGSSALSGAVLGQPLPLAAAAASAAIVVELDCRDATLVVQSQQGAQQQPAVHLRSSASTIQV